MFQGGSELFEFQNEGLACLACTFNAPGDGIKFNISENWINGVKISSNSDVGPAFSSQPLTDMGMGNLHIFSAVRIRAISLITALRYITDCFQQTLITIAATETLRARALMTSNDLDNNFKWFFVVGDPNANTAFPFIAAQTVSPMLRGASYGINLVGGVSGATFTAQISTVLAALSQILVSPTPGLETVCMIYAGGGDLGTGGYGGSDNRNVAGNLSRYLTGGWNKSYRLHFV